MIKIKIGLKIGEDLDAEKNKSSPIPNDSEWTYNPKHDPKNQNTDDLAKSRLSKTDLTQTDIKFILEHGYTPIAKSDIVVFGKGAQGKVYEVTKNGKRYACKISSEMSGLGTKKEILIRKKIEQIRQQLPPEVSKHIVRCLDIFHGKFYGLYGIILEIMRPMTDLEAEILFQGISTIDPYKSHVSFQKFRQGKGFIRVPGRAGKGWSLKNDPKYHEPNSPSPNWDDEKMKDSYTRTLR